MAKLGYYMPWYLLGGILVLVGSNLMCMCSLRDFCAQQTYVFSDTVSSSTAASAVHGFTVLMGAGAGSFLQAGYGVTQALVSPEEIADAVGFMSLGKSSSNEAIGYRNVPRVEFSADLLSWYL